MSQAPNPFTQAASQGYGDFAPTLDEEEEEEHQVVDDDDDEEEEEPQPEGPESPEPEEINELGFTQTQERSYPTGIDSPDEMSDNEQEDGPSSPLAEDSNELQNERLDTPSQSRRRVQIMNDSDNEDEEPTESSSPPTNKIGNRHLLKQLTMKNDDATKKHKKRRNDEHQQETKSKRPRQSSNTNDDDDEPTDHLEAASDVEDVVDNIFGRDVEEDGDDQVEMAAELADLNNEPEQQQEEEEDDVQQTGTFDDEDEGSSIRKNKDFVKKNDLMYDIDLYLEKKAEKRRGNRRRGGKNGDIDLAGPDTDRMVTKLIDQMKIATEEDRIFNKSRQPATAKLLLLPIVEQQLCRADLTEIFLDNGILTVFKDWLSPLPDKSLPNIKIRESLIKSLQQFGVINADPLRDSGIGKALMYLYKHPRESRENKIKLIKIIHDWARPIFNLDTDYKHLTREERQQRDADQASLKRQTSLTGKPKNRSADVDLPFSSDRRQDDDDGTEKEEDCPRARVPRPSNKDYVIRPASAVEYSEKKGDGKRKTVSRLDEVKRRQQDRKRLSKPMSIVKLSIEGNRMHL